MNTSVRQPSDQTILIIGGGIGGLAAAIGLQDMGFDVEVYEQAQELKEVGAGLSMWRNGLEALEFLGGYEAIARAGEKIVWGETRTPDGEVLTKIHTPSTIPTGTDMPEMIALHRADLQRILRNRVDDPAVHLDHECVSVDQNGGHVTAQFSSGKEVRGDLLIGADGIHSVTRSSLHGEEDPRSTGVGIWRGVTRFDHPIATSDKTFQALGNGRRFFAVPIGNGRVYWGASERVEQGGSRADSKHHLASEFDEWHDPIPALIEATPQEAIIWDEADDREPLDEWGRGSITLLGDAAHLAAPFMGQGASQALEDAVWLIRYLDRQSEPTAALRAYEAHRQDRTAMIVRSSRRIGRVYHLSNPLAVTARNLALKYGPDRLMEGALERNTTSGI
jgi:2-polyprenyl-6-methoxyphenol hydroxylase-like FAD-dependent oxidoreductase